MRTAFQAVRWIGVAVVCTSLLVILGHFAEFSASYRPIPDGPATHPLTALLAALLGAGLLLVSPVRRAARPARWLFLAAVALATLRLFGLLALGQGGAIGLDGAAAQGHGYTGVNTMATGLMIASGQLLRSRFPGPALIIAGLAPLLPLVAGFGYLFGLPALYGEMSVLSVALLLPLALGGLMSFVRRHPLRSLLCDSFFGRSARVEFLAGLGFPLAIGALIARRNPEDAVLISAQAGLMAVFAATVVVVKTRAHMKTELERRRTVRALEAAAVTDHLTGLVNRHGATRRIDRLATGCKVGVILADLDNFKMINDVYGHAGGDRVLIDAARALRDQLGARDLVARWGGEEFLVVLPGRDLDATIAVAETLRAAVARLRGPGGDPGEITASFGVSERFALETSLDGAMYRADVALYNAKGAGRDKVVRDACAGCSGIAKAVFRREHLLSDAGPMGCGCFTGRLDPHGNASTASIPDPGSLN